MNCYIQLVHEANNVIHSLESHVVLPYGVCDKGAGHHTDDGPPCDPGPKRRVKISFE